MYTYVQNQKNISQLTQPWPLKQKDRKVGDVKKLKNNKQPQTKVVSETAKNENVD